MKTRFALIILIFATGILCLTTCKKDNKNDGTHEPTEAEKEEIMNSYDEIAVVANQLLLGENPIQELEQNLQQFKSEPGVKDAWMTEEGMFVEFTNGDVISWIVTKDYLIPPYGGGREIEERIPVGNKKACLINQQYDDENRPYCKAIINHLEEKFTANGYEVTVKNGVDADLDFISTDFYNYGAIFYISHGAYDGTHTWILTGEIAAEPTGVLGKLLNDLLMSWLEGKVSIGHCKELKDGTWKIVPFYMFSEKFVESIYSSNSFPNSLIYLVACQSFKDTKQLAMAYQNKGAGVIIGWDETNCLGQSTGKLLFDILLGGSTVGEAFDALPAEAKLDKCAVAAGANLVYYPSSGKDIYLVDKIEAEVVVTSHTDGQVCDNRVQALSGYVTGMQEITSGTFEVNGIATNLVKVSYTEFSQPFLITDGDNTIKINCNGTDENGLSVFATKELHLTGDIAPLDIFTELRWNTDYSDVDFHLLPPGADISALWTGEDCYYSNMVTGWGGYLDIDDVEGYGPEHITVPSVTITGEYRLFIHFYDEDGAGTTQAYVDVSAQNGPLSSFGPYTLTDDGGDNAGDVWEVCKIEFPGGQITPVNQFYNLGMIRSNQFLPRKH